MKREARRVVVSARLDSHTAGRVASMADRRDQTVSDLLFDLLRQVVAADESAEVNTGGELIELREGRPGAPRLPPVTGTQAELLAYARSLLALAAVALKHAEGGGR